MSLKSPKYWFTTTPDGNSDDDAWWDERERREHRWFNRCYEHSGSRVRFMAGDLHAMGERESGGRAALQFGADLCLYQEDVPEFYIPDGKGGYDEKAIYDIHHLTVIFWRWGIYLSIRGRAQ